MSPSRIAIINYEVGNIGSVRNAFAHLGATVIISRNYRELSEADALVLPGVGSFSEGISNLRRLELVEPLTELVLNKKKPLLGICLGMQLLAKRGFENGDYAGLGWIDADVVRFDVGHLSLKVPHVGWNEVQSVKDNMFIGSRGSSQCFYFVHGYHLLCRDNSDIVGISNYGIDFPAFIQRDNIFAAQFHPEKSQKAGLNILKNFLNHIGQKEELCCSRNTGEQAC